MYDMCDKKIAFIGARWHKEIVDQARDSFVEAIEKHGISRQRIDVFEVPGGLEIPLMAKRLAATGRYAIVAAAALTVDGGISRHDFVAGAVVDAMMRLQLETGVPIISAVLTPHHFHDPDVHRYDDRRKFFLDHFRIKGAEAAEACAATLRTMAAIDALDSGGFQSTADRP